MFDATVGKPRKADVNKIVNEMWMAFQIDIDFEDIVKIWNIILKGNDIDLNHLEGWEQEEIMPYWIKYNQSFEYETEMNFLDDSSYRIFSEELNNSDPEEDWKQKVKNWFEWNSITQQ